MQIVIDNREKKYDKGFFYFLLNYIKKQLQSRYNRRKLKKFEDYLNLDKTELGPFKKQYSAIEIFLSSVYHLRLRKSMNDIYTIEVDPNVFYTGTQIKLIKLARALNYETADYVGYPIFTETFQEVKENLDGIYLMYERTK